MSATLPPYSALPPEAPPLYSGRGMEGEVAAETTEEQTIPEADHGHYNPLPSLLNDDVRDSQSNPTVFRARLRRRSGRQTRIV